jgi:hypothetical protein
MRERHGTELSAGPKQEVKRLRVAIPGRRVDFVVAISFGKRDHFERNALGLRFLFRRVG